jgi:peroxygenase
MQKWGCLGMRLLTSVVVSCGFLYACGQLSPGVSKLDDLAVVSASVANPTPLQRHVMFFDQNKDGVITINETKAGFRALGMGSLGSLSAATLTHVGLRHARIVVADIHKSKHGSDTGAYDKDGKFVSSAFERMWLFDKDRSQSLSRSELQLMLADNKTDTFGAIAARAEFSLLLRLAADVTVVEKGEKVPALSRERMQSFYDGSLFYRIAEERRQSPNHSLPPADATTLE